MFTKVMRQSHTIHIIFAGHLSTCAGPFECRGTFEPGNTEAWLNHKHKG